MKIYLERAAANYAKMVPTHPMEKQEFSEALEACRELTDQFEPTALKDLEAPGEPAKNGGLTRSEQLVSQDLVNFWNCLPQGGHSAAVATAVHHCQSALQSRILRRDYPNYWMSTPGSLQQDAQNEALLFHAR
ncbi:hypothetical protein ABS71_09825 [bacterium SCN 62-11]|nr:hypothetical protein [Candidatus Eremiobacteraeota bacterium]ODT68382.1 MAG: hypothetical protein ABS71_09825 [bacterium SCN 62-11]